MLAQIVTAAVLIAAGSGIARAETAAPNAAGTATMTTRQAPDSGAGAAGASPPAASVGGGITGSDAVHGPGVHEAKGLSPKPTTPSAHGK